MRRSGKNLLLGLTVLTVLFIWGNSLMPDDVSGGFSDWVGNILSHIFGGVVDTESGHGVLRKLAHGTEYLVLGMELFLLLRQLWGRPLSLVALGGVMTALIDETIQLFVEGRCGAVQDVWIDLGGFTVGCLLCAGCAAWKKQRRKG